MPRILPRLLQKIANSPLGLNERLEHRRPPSLKSLYGPLPARPSFSPVDRSQSILLESQNPILNAACYVKHKSFPPHVRVQQHAGNISKGHGRPRAMSAQERSWSANPYLRMLSSPLRLCVLTSRYLPSDFLIRLAPMQLPPCRLGQEAQTLLPDGLEHPRFKNRKSGRASYIICWKSALEQLEQRGTYKRLSKNLSLHPFLVQHIGHLLRVRVLQELEFLADQLQTRPCGANDSPVLRRLTRAELQSIKTTGVVPIENAVAVLVVPPLNRNPVTKTRTVPSSSPEFVNGGLVKHDDIPKQRLVLPLSTLYPTSNVLESHSSLPDLPCSRVPVYNGVTLFPSRSQRAALHECLLHLLFVEGRARLREYWRDSSIYLSKNGRSLGDKKASHAFLLCSDSETVRRADAAATAIALWRVRMWEGGGWHENERMGH